MKKINLLKNATVCNLESAFKLTHNANIAHDVMSHSRSGITYTVGNALKSITNAEHAVTKLMHVQLQSCTMNANDANTVKFLVVQLQHHVIHWAVAFHASEDVSTRRTKRGMTIRS